jgi:hypothetical protein
MAAAPGFANESAVTDDRRVAGLAVGDTNRYMTIKMDCTFNKLPAYVRLWEFKYAYMGCLHKL